MSISHTQTSTTTLGPSGNVLSGAATETGAVEHLLDESFTALTADQLVGISFGYATVKAIWLLASTDLGLATNTAAPGHDNIALKAGVPFLWTATAAYFANPFTANVTGFYFTCTLACHLQGLILTS